MNYCIINGKKSTLVKGLLIQSLPPISKPLMRTSIEEIDGRDGDVVTKLGYSAYDKQMSIGLFGDYDIDEVIQYFTQDGTVIFSNEPDKYYNFELIAQIDFERLVKFKTATVTFHCQPFKFSAVDDNYIFDSNMLDLRVWHQEKFGIEIRSEGGKVSIKGNTFMTNEFYMPIKAMTLVAGDYTLKALTDGSGESGVKMRVIGNNPTDADSFGGTYMQLLDAGETTLSATPTESKTYNYIWFQIQPDTEIDFTMTLELFDNNLDSCKVFNRGNEIARPILTIYGSGTIDLSINGVHRFEIALANNGYITLDGEKMDAYKGDVLMNRSVQGDYENLALKVGMNQLSWTGNITRIKFEKIARWT